MKDPEISVAAIVSPSFEENGYVARLAGRNDCLVVDPGLEPQKIIDYLGQHQLTPAMILNTHGHSDHIAGNGPLKRLWPDCRLVIGRGDAEKLGNPRLNLSAMFGMELKSPPADQLVAEGDRLSAAGIEMEVRDVPGHTAGHVVYLVHTGSPLRVFVGDVIFAGSVGRTDFPDGDFDQLAAGIRSKLYCLPDDTELLSGHGPSTTVGREKRTNPYVRVEPVNPDDSRSGR